MLATLTAEVTGPPARTYGELIAGARELERRLAALDDFVLDKEKAALHGVATADVVRTLRVALAGAAPATVHEPGERQPLLLRVVLPRAERSGRAELRRLAVKGADGHLVPLGEIGAFEERVEDQPIFHKDLERVVFVLGEVAGRPPADVVFAMGDSLAADPLPGGIEARWSGEGEWQITVDVFRDLGSRRGSSSCRCSSWSRSRSARSGSCPASGC